MLHSLMHIQTNRDGVIGRRSFLRSLSRGTAGTGILGFKDALTLRLGDLACRVDLEASHRLGQNQLLHS